MPKADVTIITKKYYMESLVKFNNNKKHCQEILNSSIILINISQFYINWKIISMYKVFGKKKYYFTAFNFLNLKNFTEIKCTIFL